MAFICNNKFDLSEFDLRKPTPVMEGDKEMCSVIRYSDIRRVPARNVIICEGS